MTFSRIAPAVCADAWYLVKASRANGVGRRARYRGGGAPRRGLRPPEVGPRVPPQVLALVLTGGASPRPATSSPASTRPAHPRPMRSPDPAGAPAPAAGSRGCPRRWRIAQRLALLHALAIVADGVVLVVEVGAQHALGILGQHHRQRLGCRHTAQVIDVLGDRQGVLQLLARVHFQLLGNAHVFRALEGLRVDHVRDDRLILARQILVQQADELFAGHGLAFVF